MKHHFRKKSLCMAAAAGLLTGSQLLGAVLLEDDFSGSALDPAKWSVANYNNGTAVIENGAVKITARGHLNTVQEFDLNSDASLVGGLDITGQVKFAYASDFLQLLTRSDGTPAGGYGETKTGVEMLSSYADKKISLQKRGLSFTSTEHFNNGANFAPTLNEYYNFRLLDSGGSTGNTYFEITSLDGSQSWSYSYRYTGMPTTEKNLVTFHNREHSNSCLYLDNIKIATGCDSTAAYVSDDFDSGTLDPTKWTTHNPKSGNITLSNGVAKILQRSYLNTFQNFDPSAHGEDAPLTITMDWSMNNTGDMLQILTRSDGLAAGNYGESNSGIEFYLSDKGQLTIKTRADGTESSLITSEASLTKYAGITYAVTVTDNGNDLTFDVYEKGNPSNRVTVSTQSTHRIDAADGQFVSSTIAKAVDSRPAWII